MANSPAEYRALAKRYLEMADDISAGSDAPLFRAFGTEYLRLAEEAEANEQTQQQQQIQPKREI
jgi:hypothetical protein